MTEKKNPDFTNSAVSLTNSPEVLAELLALRMARKCLDTILASIEAAIPDAIKDKRDNIEKDIENIGNHLRHLIDTEGGYQDVQQGIYALSQARKTVTYLPSSVRHIIGDQLADLV